MAHSFVHSFGWLVGWSLTSLLAQIRLYQRRRSFNQLLLKVVGRYAVVRIAYRYHKIGRSIQNGIAKPRLHDTTGCQTRLTTGLTTVLNEQLFVQPVLKPGCTTGLTTGCIHDTAVCQTGLTTGCIVYTNILPGCQTGCNRFDNRLYCVNGALTSQ